MIYGCKKNQNSMHERERERSVACGQMLSNTIGTLVKGKIFSLGCMHKIRLMTFFILSYHFYNKYFFKFFLTNTLKTLVSRILM